MTSKYAPHASVATGAANRAKIKRLVRAAGIDGIGMAALRVATGLSGCGISMHLRALRAAGAIEPSHDTGRSVKWGVPGIFEAHQDARDREAARRKARKLRKSCASAAQCEENWFERQPVHRLVAANTEPPLRPRGPVSVFALAQGAA